MKCDYCGKEAVAVEKKIAIITYVNEKPVSAFCSLDCQKKSYKKASRLLQKMSRKDLLEFAKTFYNKETLDLILSNTPRK